jgi:mannosyl-oligosaccharide glucosidase
VGTRELVRDVLVRPVSRLVPHIGYVSLFPFMGKIIPSVSFTFQGTLVTEKNCFTSFFGSLAAWCSYASPLFLFFFPFQLSLL